MKTQIITADKRGITLAKAALTLILLLAFITAIPGSGEARQNKKQKKSPEEVTAMLAERLGLSEEQHASIQPIIEAGIVKRQELMEQIQQKKKEQREATRSAMETIEQESADELGSVLTQKQMEKYSEMKEQQREKLEERRTEKSKQHDERRGNCKSDK